MKPITKYDIQQGKMFSDGNDLIYEIENFVHSSDANPIFESITVFVKQYCAIQSQFIFRRNKEIKFSELRPIPDKPEFERIRLYNI